MELPVGER